MIDHDDPFESVIEEGPVEVSFFHVERGRVGIQFRIDFSKTDHSSSEASEFLFKVAKLLRKEFKVKLDEIKG